jgi:hypothetical protein
VLLAKLEIVLNNLLEYKGEIFSRRKQHNVAAVGISSLQKKHVIGISNRIMEEHTNFDHCGNVYIIIKHIGAFVYTVS